MLSSEGPIGSKIMIKGEGFTPRTGIFLTFEDLLFFTPIFIDEKGQFNATIFVPVVNAGNYTIKAVGTYYYSGSPQALAMSSFRVTTGLDTLFENIDNIQKALNQTQSAVQIANDGKTSFSSSENAKSAEALASEARVYALAAMIFAIISATSSAITLTRRK